ncbi:Der GTPase-activating protein YihI [Paraglaciecola sp. L3A3]|uniref:Der GTPase-activating protein YihI n=1 Tax=Paraglaciecola sp. L3A3 TaxID=2686358 RepID=UPI00131E14D2|nr:Der GTPase-activating protein YihI [Paraglaciecola sp. L3A3]
MPRKKKSRKVGQIGIPKSSSNTRKPKPAEQRTRKHLGKPAGSRNSEVILNKDSVNNNAPKDPRHGSKKPIDLFPTETKKETTSKVKHFSPAKELETIEKDEKLSSLLDKAELGKKLSKEEQNYVDKNLARHKVLCGLLGLDNEEEDTSEHTADPFTSFESINIDDYKD